MRAIWKCFGRQPAFPLLFLTLAIAGAGTASAGTYVVNRNDDIAPRGTGVTCITAASTDCTLREAVIKANANPGSVIQFAAATNGTPITLTQANPVTGGYPNGQDENAAATGDLDVTAAVTITGNGEADTIIQAGTSTLNGIDKVFGINPNCDVAINVTISRVTVRYGRNTQPTSDPLFAFTGGGLDFCSYQTSSFFFSDSTASDNTAVTAYGGGLNLDTNGASTGTITLTNVKFLRNRTNSTTSQATGGGMNVFGRGYTLNISGSTFDSNVVDGAEGGGMFIRPTENMNINIHTSTFSNNTAGSRGGGLSYLVSGAAQILTIDQGSSFTGNTSGTLGTGTAEGGGLYVSVINSNSGFTLTKSTVTGNGFGVTADKRGGGGIAVGDAAGAVVVSLSRIVNNSIGSPVSGANQGTGLHKDNNAGSVTATKNWWGCNGGPGAAGCDSAVVSGGGSGGPGVISATPWIVLKTTASSSPINYGQSTGLTTSFLQDSSSGALSTAQIAVLIGLPVTWANVLHGSLSGAQTTIQSNGMATATFTAGSTSADCGPGGAEAKVDNVQDGDTTATAAVTVNCPDVTLVKTNNVSGTTQLVNGGGCPAQCWTWTLTGANGGPGFGTYTNGQTIVSDNLPNSNVGYGPVTVTPVSGITGTIDCSINGSDDFTCTANGSVQINSGGSFTASFLATPTAVATYANPRAAGSCAIDPNNNLPETSDANNSASNSVVVTAPDLTVVKSNDVSGATTLGNNWTWKLHVANSSASATATFTVGQTIVTDDLDNGGNLSYGAPAAGNGSNITNIGNVSCSIVSNTLACSATGTVTIGTSGSFDVTFTATPSAIGTYANPRSGGTGAVDPSSVVPETNEGNNGSNTDSVTVTAPDLTLSKANNVSGQVATGQGWNWTLTSSNVGGAGAIFTAGATILQDDLDNSGGVTYGSPTVANVTNVTNSGSILCSINGSQTLTCIANGATVTIGATTGKFDAVVPVTSVADGTYANPRSVGVCRIDPNGVAAESDETNNNATSNSVVVVSPPTISKAFGASSILLNGTTSLSFTITNPNTTTALSGVGFSDTLPAGLTVPDATTSECGGTLTVSANVITLSGASIAASGTCTPGVTVTGTTAGVKSNTTGAVGSTESGAGATSNTATVTVIGPPTISKAFGDTTIPLGGTTSLGFTITNPNTTTALSGVGFSDTLPAGLTAPDATTSECGGTLTVSANVITLSGASIAASGTCTPGMTVTGATAGVKNNTTGAVSSADGGTGTASNTATVTVVAPPTISKAFGAANLALGGTTSLDFTITNPNTTVALTGVGFSDTLPAGLTAPDAVTSPCGGTLTVSANVITLSGATIAASGTCTPGVTVTGATAGVKNNTTGAVSSTNGGTGTTSNTATLTVASPPTISKAFGASSILLNGTTSLSFTITNPNTTTALSGVGFSDTLPAGLTVPDAITSECGGTLTVSANVITLSGASIAASDTCTLGVTVTGTTAGVKNNTTGAISSTESGAGTTSNTATVTVIGPPTISKAFGDTTIPLGGTTSLTFTISNPNTTTALSGVGFSDTLPAGLTAPDASTSACGGTLTVSANVITLSGASIAASGTCTPGMTVTGATAGVKNNTTGAVSSADGGTGTTSNTATVTVVAPPTISKAFGDTTIPLGGTTSLGFTITNPNATVALSGVAFTDSLPAGLTAPDATTSPCGGTLTVSANVITLSGATIAASGTCTPGVTVTGATVGVKNNTTGAVSSANGGTGTTSNTATVTVVAPPTISKAFGDTTIPLNGTTSLSFTITNPNATAALSGVAFADSLPAGLTVPDAITSECGGTLTVSANVITLSGASIAASDTCTLGVTVTGTTAGVKNNTTGAVSSANGGTGTTSNTATVTVVAPPTISKAFGAANLALGSATSLSFTITNPNSTVALTGVGFSDTLPAGLTAPDATTSECGGTLTVSANVITLSGASIAASGTCTPGMTVTGATAGVKNNTTGAVSSADGGTGTTSNTATVTVVAPPTISKAFGDTTIPLGGTTSLSFTITNPNATVALSGVAFTDSLPAGLTAPDATTSPCGGTLTVSANVITLSGASIAASGNCVFGVTVTGATVGVKNNTTGAVSSTNGGTGTTSNTATLTVGMPDLVITKTHSGLLYQGQVGAQYTITVSNVGTLPTDGSTVTVIDSLPVGLTATALSGTGWTCVLGTLTCTRSDALPAGSNYPVITLTVNVAQEAPASLTNTVVVSGGGEVEAANDSGSDPAPITEVIPLLGRLGLALLMLALAGLGALGLLRRG